MRRTDPLIVGGGPAGAAAAITLAGAGARPLLIERNAGPTDVVCGAFMGWDALGALRALDLDPWALGAHRIERLRIVAGRRVIERALPRAAAGLSRRTLDEALLARAAAGGVTVRRGAAVRGIDSGGARLADGSRIEAEAIFLATGKHDVRGSPRPGAKGGHVGLRTALPHIPALTGFIELHLFDGGYAGLLLQEDGCSNLCIAIAEDRLRMAGSPARLVAMLAEEAPHLGARIGGIPHAWVATAQVPYGWRAHATPPGLFRLGDQAAVIASLAGDGIAIALASGRAAAAAWSDGGAEAAPAFQRRFAARTRRPIALAEALRHTAERPRAAAAALAGPARLPGLLALAARLTRVGA